MKVIQIYKPLQDSNTELDKLELVEYVTKTEDDFKNPGTIVTSVHKKVPYWTVRTENIKLGDTYHQWLLKKKEEIEGVKFKEKKVEGIYLYDIQTVLTVNNEPAIMVRYDYIYRNSLDKIGKRKQPTK
jgi:hypothetical protein